MKSRAVEAATLRPHTQAITMLHDKHTHSATATTYLPEFVQPETSVVVQPLAHTMGTEDQQITAANYDGESDEQSCKKKLVIMFSAVVLIR